MPRADFDSIAVAQIAGGRRMNRGQIDGDQNVKNPEVILKSLLHIVA